MRILVEGSKYKMSYLKDELLLNETFYEPKGEMHPLFKELQKTSDLIHGNFEKFIVSRDGSRYIRFCNSDLLDMAYSSGNRDVSPEEALKNIKKAIEDFIQEEYDENNIN